jgi:hypothetical protein
VAAVGLPHRLVAATTDIAKGRRYGNRVLLASAAPLDRDALGRRLRRLPWPARLLDPRPAPPFTADDAHPSPAPPELERGWRVR